MLCQALPEAFSSQTGFAWRKFLNAAPKCFDQLELENFIPVYFLSFIICRQHSLIACVYTQYLLFHFSYLLWNVLSWTWWSLSVAWKSGPGLFSGRTGLLTVRPGLLTIRPGLSQEDLSSSLGLASCLGLGSSQEGVGSTSGHLAPAMVLVLHLPWHIDTFSFWRLLI